MDKSHNSFGKQSTYVHDVKHHLSSDNEANRSDIQKVIWKSVRDSSNDLSNVLLKKQESHGISALTFVVSVSDNLRSRQNPPQKRC